MTAIFTADWTPKRSARPERISVPHDRHFHGGLHLIFKVVPHQEKAFRMTAMFTADWTETPELHTTTHRVRRRLRRWMETSGTTMTCGSA
jgi:hypothetical protein